MLSPANSSGEGAGITARAEHPPGELLGDEVEGLTEKHADLFRAVEGAAA